MLRRKLVLVFGLLVALLLATAVGAIWTLQGILADLRHLDTEAWLVNEQAHELGMTISQLEIELYELEVGRKRRLDRLIDLVEAMHAQVDVVGQSYVCRQDANGMILEQIRQDLNQFSDLVSSLGTASDPQWANRHRGRALGWIVRLRSDILQLSRHIHDHGKQEQAELTSRFRWMVLGLTLVFLLVINAAIVVLLRTSTIVLRPVEKLLEATRQLGHERFDYRVDLDQKDEFDELARAYNSLAGQLQANEQRKLETLAQVAATLNHELNTAVAIIELQLQLLSRQAGGNVRVEKCARQIHESLARMTRTVELLKRVRRIVLTDYVSGVKMLDLEKSAQELEPEPEPQEEPEAGSLR
jgi:nitrate/nitrite-specific signal transduction histidine kinase